MRAGRASLALVIGVVLAACSAGPVKPGGLSGTDLDRQEYFAGIDAWAFNGRVALSDGNDSGSGSLEWVQDDVNLKIDFRAALGRGAWKLAAGPGRAVLQTGKGETYYSSDVSELVAQHLGWHVPMDALPFWVLGLALPGAQARLEIDEQGLLRLLHQLGWEISYDRWETDYHPAMPVRITASRDEYSFKLIIRRWRIPESS